MARAIVHGDALGKLLVDALGLPETCARIIIDVPANGPLVVYVQFFGTQELLELDWEEALEGAEVIKVRDG